MNEFNRSNMFQKLHIDINNTQIIFYGGLFDCIQAGMLHAKLATSHPSHASLGTLQIEKDPIDIEKIIESITPDLMVIQVSSTEVKSFDKNNSFHYHLLLQKIEVKARSRPSPFASRVKVTNLRIYTPACEVLHSKELSIDVKRDNNIFVIDTKLDTLSAQYCHEDIYGWWLKIFTAGMKSNRRELILKAFRMSKDMAIEFYHSEFTQRLFDHVILNQTVETSNVRLVFVLEDQVSSINVTQAKIGLSQFDTTRQHSYDDYTLNLILKRREWQIELSSEGPLCWYMDRKFDYLSSDSMKTYIRGSAAYIGRSLLRLGSHADAFKVNLDVNTLRTEYSQKLTSFVVFSVKSVKEYIDLFSQLNNSAAEATLERRERVEFEKILSQITIEAKVSEISCFFINRHDVCTFVSLSDVMSIDSFSYSLENLQVSTIDFSGHDAIYDFSELSSVYVSTKSLKFNLIATNDQPQVGVDFTEKLECSWNAHFLRHLLSLLRDFHRFRRSVDEAAGISRAPISLLPRSQFPVGFDIKKLRNIRIKHHDVNVDKLMLLINELSGENLFFYHYFN